MNTAIPSLPQATESMTASSHLYVPADNPRLIAKVAARNGVVIVDLEDAVAPSRKDLARELTVQFLFSGPTPEVWVRVNSGPNSLRDASALIVGPALAGIWLAKAEDAALLAELSAIVNASDHRVRLGLMVETARGALHLDALLATGVADLLQIGEIDLAADLGHTVSRAENLEWARHLVVAHSAAAGLAAPVAPVDQDYRDLDRFRATSTHLREIGFGGRACIHPNQVQVADDVFGISASARAEANALLDAYEIALANGQGVGTDAAGLMVDAATVRSARRLTGR